MKVFTNPSAVSLKEILSRPETDQSELSSSVSRILADVRQNGNTAVRQYANRFDSCDLGQLMVSEEAISTARERISSELKNAIDVARENIAKFHSSQLENSDVVETTEGVFCWRRSVPIERVGLYVPGGTAPLFSTVLMLAVPAKLAGCREIVVCTPPDSNGNVSDVVLYAAAQCGVTRIFSVGGAQAIAAMAYGTESVPKVDKIFGPGNRYVTCAKQLVSTEVAIDMPAGPSELAVFADETSVPAFVAADLLSQAEHGSDSQVLLVSTSEQVIARTLSEVEKQLADLPRRDIASVALENSKAILVADDAAALEIINEYAPEHLILAVASADETAQKIINAGSVFLGNYSCESAGDYASGTNHTLPTAGFARSFSGVSLDSFVKKITFQKITVDGLRNLGPAIETMAAAEGLEAHRRAVSIRSEVINGI
jgi:histidinol dehydrogenase